MVRDAKIDGKLNSLVGKDSNFTGDFNVKGGLRIDGKLKGNINADIVFLGKDSSVDGNITSSSAVIGGKVKGDIIATDSLELQGNARVIGDITTNRIVVEDGVVFNGFCDMGQGSTSSKKTNKKNTMKEEEENNKSEEEEKEKKDKKK